MDHRLVAAAATVALVAVPCAGCFTPDDKSTQRTAHITVDNTSRTSHAITCNQVNWLLTANISVAPANVKVLLRLDPDKPKVESVNIDNFAGFSGVANSGAGEATIRVVKDVYTITGTAAGSQLNDTHVSVTKPFSVEVGC
ncbi:lipoprotein LpqH [Mycobacterium paraterrae]|uniref:Lipoprotein LpqH n=1 Tax=Mycobacterium paraterrae TaxID=577492 RepID=A0ABY3VRS5_9MYCO|nr:lipoprotein LpqH [Mycobacterium paraterrae]UMB71109.1 lipoprotein LpqH [Mycobacterium paraterrae]